MISCVSVTVGALGVKVTVNRGVSDGSTVGVAVNEEIGVISGVSVTVGGLAAKVTVDGSDLSVEVADGSFDGLKVNVKVGVSEFVVMFDSGVSLIKGGAVGGSGAGDMVEVGVI